MFFCFYISKQGVKKNKTKHQQHQTQQTILFIMCKQQKWIKEYGGGEPPEPVWLCIWWLCWKNMKNFTQLWYLLNCRSTFHVHKIKVSKISVDGHMCVCVWEREYCACVALEGTHQPHFHFCSISARISVIPLKSRGSPTVTSYNGANAGVVGTQLRLLGSIWFTFTIPQPVCMQT